MSLRFTYVLTNVFKENNITKAEKIYHNWEGKTKPIKSLVKKGTQQAHYPGIQESTLWPLQGSAP